MFPFLSKSTSFGELNCVLLVPGDEAVPATMVGNTEFFNNLNTTFLLSSSTIYSVSFRSKYKPLVDVNTEELTTVMPVVFQRKLPDAPKESHRSQLSDTTKVSMNFCFVIILFTKIHFFIK